MKTYLYVTPFFPTPTSWRGAYSYDFIRALQRVLAAKKSAGGEKWRIVVLKEGKGADYEIGGVSVYTFRALRMPSNIFPNLFARVNQRSFLTTVCRLGVNLDDVAVCHANVANYGIYPLAVKKANPSCMTILQHHDLQSFGLNMGVLCHCWLYNLIQFLVLRAMHEKIDVHVFISEASRRSFLMAPDTSWTQYPHYKKQMRWLPWRPVKIENSVILHNGVDRSIFTPGDSGDRDTIPIENRKFVIGCVGNFQVLKDQKTLVEAVGILMRKGKCAQIWRGGLKVIFVGSGETLAVCKAEAEKLHAMSLHWLEFEFMEEMPHEKLVCFYRGLDLFVLPSWFEGFGCVCVEAYSSGVPFITCEGQGLDDLFYTEDRDRWLCKQRDPDDLAHKIDDCICSLAAGRMFEQRLAKDLDIDVLVGDFVKELDLNCH